MLVRFVSNCHHPRWNINGCLSLQQKQQQQQQWYVTNRDPEHMFGVGTLDHYGLCEARAHRHDARRIGGISIQWIAQSVRRVGARVVRHPRSHARASRCCGRLRPAHALAEHLLHNTSCDVMVLKPPPTTHTDDEVSEILAQLS